MIESIYCIEAIEPKVCVPPIEFTLCEFEHLKSTCGGWFSPSFYSHQSILRYQFCLEVYSNGCRGGIGTHVSLYTCIMQGQFDDSLLDSTQAPHPGEFGPEGTIEATIDAGPGGFWPESRPQARYPSSQVSTVLRHLVLGSFWPKSRLQARSPSSQQYTVLRYLILGSLDKK